jgi:chemotaxis protein CheZ
MRVKDMARRASRADRVSQVLEEIGVGTNSDITINEILALAQTMSRSLDSVYRAVDASIQREFREIGSYIESMKSDIAGLQANDLKQTHLPTAGKELGAVVEATEEATNTIMECAEAIMSADDSDHDAYKAVVDDNIMKIFEACSFQDITGQRISKVVETLTMIDERVSRFAHRMRVEDAEGHANEEEAGRAQRKKDLLLDGPQQKGEGVSQDDVDNLFSAA